MGVEYGRVFAISITGVEFCIVLFALLQSSSEKKIYSIRKELLSENDILEHFLSYRADIVLWLTARQFAWVIKFYGPVNTLASCRFCLY